MISWSNIIERESDIRPRVVLNYTGPNVNEMKSNDVGTHIYKMVTMERRGREGEKLQIEPHYGLTGGQVITIRWLFILLFFFLFS